MFGTKKFAKKFTIDLRQGYFSCIDFITVVFVTEIAEYQDEVTYSDLIITSEDSHEHLVNLAKLLSRVAAFFLAELYFDFGTAPEEIEESLGFGSDSREVYSAHEGCSAVSWL